MEDSSRSSDIMEVDDVSSVPGETTRLSDTIPEYQIEQIQTDETCGDEKPHTSDNQFLQAQGHVALNQPKPTLLTLLSGGGQYLILRALIEPLHKRDVASLRTTCRTLYGSVLPEYPWVLGIYCKATHPDDRSFYVIERTQVTKNAKWTQFPRKVCNEGPIWDGLIDTCRGYINQPLGQGTFTHDENYWVCGRCVKEPSFTGRGILGYVNEAGVKNFGSLVPICKDCYSLAHGIHVEMKKEGACSCQGELEDAHHRGWFCRDCAEYHWETKFINPIQGRLQELEAINRSHEILPASESMYICGRCEQGRFPVMKDKSQDWYGVEAQYFMCVRCEDVLELDSTVQTRGSFIAEHLSSYVRNFRLQRITGARLLNSEKRKQGSLQSPQHG